VTHEEKKKPDGCLNWFKVLNKVTDEDLKLISGTDGALYIMFLRFVYKLFIVLSLVNGIFLIPIYVSGSVSKEQEEYIAS
jgi:hypothetical protein